MLKAKNGIASKIISKIFKFFNSTSNLRNKDFVSYYVQLVYFGIELLSNLAPKLWVFYLST